MENEKVEIKDPNDYVCHTHQCMASKCGCLSFKDFCSKCGTEKTTSVDGTHCRLCNW